MSAGFIGVCVHRNPGAKEMAKEWRWMNGFRQEDKSKYFSCRQFKMTPHT